MVPELIRTIWRECKDLCMARHWSLSGCALCNCHCRRAYSNRMIQTNSDKAGQSGNRIKQPNFEQRGHHLPPHIFSRRAGGAAMLHFPDRAVARVDQKPSVFGSSGRVFEWVGRVGISQPRKLSKHCLEASIGYIRTIVAQGHPSHPGCEQLRLIRADKNNVERKV